MRIAYLDCSAGAAGDMLLAALLDAGASLARLRATMAALGIDADLDVALEEVAGPAFRASRLRAAERSGARPRQLPDALEAIDRSGLSATVRERARRTIGRLAEVESRLHAVPLDQLRLHELSAADTLLDVVGFHAACEELAIDAVEASPVNVGGGTVTFSHGTFAVPPPAVAELLRGIPVRGDTDESGELVTPTAAAILATGVRRFGAPPELRIERIGYAVGTREHAAPRVLRCLVGELEIMP